MICSNVALPAAFRSGGCAGDENGKRTARSPSVHNRSTICPSPDEERINAFLMHESDLLKVTFSAFHLLTQRLHNLNCEKFNFVVCRFKI